MSALDRVPANRGGRPPAPAAPRARRSAALLATPLVAIALLLAAGPASAATAQVSGTWHTTAESTEGVKTAIYDVEVKWAESFDGAFWSLSQLSGKVQLSGSTPPGESPCVGTLKEAAGAAGAFLAGQRAGSGGRLAPKVAYVPETGKWQIFPVEPISGELLESSGAAGSGCASSAIGTQSAGFVEQEGKYSSWTASGTTGNYFLEGKGGPTCKQVSASTNLVEFPPETALTQADECAASGSFADASAHVSWTAALDQQVTFSTPVVIHVLLAPVGKTTVATKATKSQALEQQLHLQAHMDLNEAVVRAKIACGLEPNHSIYGPLDVTALPGELGEPSMQALNPLVSAGVGALLGSTAAPDTVASCKAATLEVKRALERYLADPPDLSYDRLAPAPAPAHAARRARGARAGACALASGSAAANCRTVLQAAATLTSARAKVEGVEEALTTVSNRLATASAAGSQSAITLQSAASDALMGELSAAHEVQNSAQRALATALAKYKLKITLKPSAAARGVAQLSAKAAALGVATSQLKAAAAGELVKRKLTFASVLDARASTTVSLAMWRSQTLEGLLAVYSAMKSSGQIPSEQRAALDADISGAFAASAGTARLTKLKAFAATAATIKTNAGALLHYAAEPLA